MPITGKTIPHSRQPLYFKSLKELDNWSAGGASNRYDGIVKYQSRRPGVESLNRGKLLVCHDYKGGYTESPFARSYTFNFWPTCDTFIYFSHHRVTIPPPGWISAAHRQGVKMLGTLIFEGGGEEDCLRLLVGKMPTSKTGQVGQSATCLTLPLSPHYARVLADLARERGFDGYLLNFECPLAGGVEQTRALAAWITLLHSEILEKVGPHGETLWYDSVVINGRLAWQDRLNSYNLPFFLSSSGFFSNYTWRPNYPALTAQYFLSLDPALVGNTAESYSHRTSKTVRDIYIGVDVWGRGQHGGGGLGCYKAISHISPETLGLSVALFGQAWTWESEQDKPGWTWDSWWEYESKLWVGPVDGRVEVPEAPRRQGEPDCLHGPFVPLSSFFQQLPPPDPSQIRFHTTFCPGTGLAWFVDGKNVYTSPGGWTDVDKQTSVGDMLWPRPKLFWEDEREDVIPNVLSAFCMDDAWNGGNSIRIKIFAPGSNDELAAYRPLWLPIQSLSIAPRKPYKASLIYKVDDDPASGLEIEFALAVRTLSGSTDDFVCNIVSATTEELSEGWNKLSIEFNTSTSDEVSSPPSHVVIGLVVAMLTEEPSEPVKLSILLGQLNASPSLPQSYSEEDPVILWADFTPTPSTSEDVTPARFSGTLTWEVAACFPPLTSLNITTPEDPISAWNTQPTINWFPSYIYFNIYALPFTDQWNVGPVEQAVWIGTSGWDGQKNGFDVLPENLPMSVPADNIKIRFFVQGVNDRGEVLKWGKCAFIDVSA
ncbi:Cytosolic endo-beta-N-acetylglucosaminidase 1 [Psilocybe cubensis]|uniref:Cytosolic endo-beta-N-acetylglucosaminidase TIM barrel domain-containing protein n=2 Tax=Psilocybe cubensis TaxID=181762 RepID=A0A8H7XLR1_PSICU|nr:Cytosolic endo-beta-N-acetylglucosaminidase 1 [Psilocybe cubensis]KAH9483196.1 Cytosolic endo-beta-N-acetylglucosaminidase 1 [Psilocybe cubensis]